MKTRTDHRSRRRLPGAAPAAGGALLLIVLLAGLLPALPARAHALAPSLLELRETASGEVDVRWKTSAITLPGVRLEPTLEPACRPLGTPAVVYEETMAVSRFRLDCDGLVGRTVAVDGLDASKTEVLVRVELADGRRAGGLLRAREPSLLVPERPTRARLARDYAALGVEHILLGFDHLLFVLGLLLLVRGRRLLVATITAFTAGHSVTLTLVALGHTPRLPSAWVETAIAASILLLAVELARPGNGGGWMRRRPWAMAGGFGLLHGLGFAGALAEIGLPQVDVPWALFAFNLGIEAGQLAFVAVALTLAHAATRVLRAVSRTAPAWSLQAPVYVMGTLAAFWTLERLAQAL